MEIDQDEDKSSVKTNPQYASENLDEVKKCKSKNSRDVIEAIILDEKGRRKKILFPTSGANPTEYFRD